MHMHTVDEAVAPRTWAFRHHGVEKNADEATRRANRKVGKRNRGRKLRTLRAHRQGR